MGPLEILRDYKERLREEPKEKLKVQSNAYQAIVKELKDWSVGVAVSVYVYYLLL